MVYLITKLNTPNCKLSNHCPQYRKSKKLSPIIGTKGMTDLPEHAKEQIVSVLAKNNADLVQFYGFGLSSKLFYRPTIHALDREKIFFPLDIVTNDSNKRIMKYISKYDDVSRDKLGIRIVDEDSYGRHITQFLRLAATAMAREERQWQAWVNGCKRFKKLFFDKIDFRNPVCFVNCRQIFRQNCNTLEILKVQNVMDDPEGISFLTGLIIACKNLKDLEVIWNIKYFDDQPARNFRYALFDIMDGSPNIEILRIQVPEKVTNRSNGKEEDGPKLSLIIYDMKRRFFYEKTGFSKFRPQIIHHKNSRKTRIRKLFSINGQPFYRTDE